MPLKIRETILIGLESTYGTDPVLAATDAVLVYDFDWKFSGEKYARAVTGPSLLRRRASVLGKRSVEITFKQEIKGYSTDYGAGVAVPAYDAALQACMYARKDDAGDPMEYTYYQDRGSDGSVAIEFEIDGIVCIALGCRGNARFVLMPGEIGWIEFTFQGLFTLPSDRVISTPDYTGDVAPPIVAATGFTPWADNPVAGAWGHTQSLVVDTRAVVVPRGSLTVGAEGIAAFEHIGCGTKDDPGSAVAIEVEQKASTDGDDFFTRWDSRTVSGSVSVAIGSDAGNTHTITINDFVIEDIQFGDLDGRIGNILDCRVQGEATVPAAASEDGITLVAT